MWLLFSKRSSKTTSTSVNQKTLALQATPERAIRGKNVSNIYCTVINFYIFFSVDQQLRCFMGFSITACIISGIMFICYCVAVDYFATALRCRRNNVDYTSYYSSYYSKLCYSESQRNMPSVGAGLGSLLLILSVAEWFVALASSIYCCNATSCCGTPTVSCVS